MDSDYQREFEFVLIVDGVETEFTLKANETIEFEIPVGSVYEVRENDYFTDGFVQSVVNGTGTAGDDTVNVYVSNTYVDEPMIEISGEKTWVIGEVANVNLPEAITIQLNNGDVLVEEKTVMPDENGLWTYDTASYVITITITENDGILFSDVAISKNGTDCEEIVFVNTYDEIPADETIIISGKKTWKHGNNPENKRPTSIIVEVYADGELAVQRQINAEVDNWQYNFEVPKYAEDGHEIVYTIDEAYVKDYSKTVDGYDITNTYVGKPDEPDKPVDPPDSPETGDNSMLMLWFMLVNISGIGIVVAIIYCRRNRRLRERL